MTEQILTQISPLVFINKRGFDIEKEAAEMVAKNPGLNKEEAKLALRLVLCIHESEDEYLIGPVKHPQSGNNPEANVMVIELSERCFRLKEWVEFLAQRFSEIQKNVIERAIRRYIYLRHMR